MKKFIFSIAALAAIVVMGSCSQDSDLTSQKSSSKVDSVTVGLNLNSGIEVTESSSNMGKSTANSANTSLTRAGNTDGSTTDPFNIVDNGYSTSYTAYFVSSKDQTINSTSYKAGQIVKIKTVKEGNNSLTVPNIEYNIYVTNYTPTTDVTGTSSITLTNLTEGTVGETDIQHIENNLPAYSTTLYLFGQSSGVSLSNNSTVSITLTSEYAAVCVHVDDNYIKDIHYGESSGTASETNKYATDKTGKWYYMYIKPTLSNSTIDLAKSMYVNGTSTSTYSLNQTISANTVYKYTIGSYDSGILEIKVATFSYTNNQDLDPTE